MIRNKVLWFSLLLSLFLHFVGLFWVRQWWLEEVDEEVFRARLLAIPPRFEPKRLGASKPIELPQQQMEYLTTEANPQELEEMGLEVRALPRSRAIVERPPNELEEVGMGAKSSTPILAREEMSSPTQMEFVDSLGIEAMELLRLIDLARANRDHGMVVPDMRSVRDLVGYLNITRLQLYGAGSDTAGAIDALARYLRDQTGLLVQMRDAQYHYFLSEHLLKDPIHFLFQGGGLQAYDPEYLTRFSEEEYELLGRYLRQGGFLFIEGYNRFLREMTEHLAQILGEDGRIYELPPTHPIYHAFYSFPSGFPGEQKGRLMDVEGPAWDYPEYQARETAEIERQNAFNPFFQEQETEPLPPPLGLWGVEVDGELVAVFSDLRLYTQWTGAIDPVTGDPVEATPSLSAATNVVVYALTRPSGLTVKRARPVWAQVRPDVPLSFAPEAEGREDFVAVDDSDLFDALDGALALLRSPLGDPIGRGGVEVVVDGNYTLALLQRQRNGLLLHNVPVGTHWIEVRYQGQSKQLEVNLAGGKVTTVVFGINRIAFFSQLRLKIQTEEIGVSHWLGSFADFQIEEVFLSDEEKVLLKPLD